MEYFAQQAINAIQTGSIYALVALGYSLVYGVLVMINFAHSSLFMVGPFFYLLFLHLLGPDFDNWKYAKYLRALNEVSPPFLTALILAMVLTGLLGVLIERFAYRPLRNAPRVSAIITALGCGLVIENTTLSLSPYDRPMPTLIANTSYQFGGITISSLQLIIIGVAVALMLGLDFLIRKTRYGIAMRAISFDSRTVPLMGVPVNRIIALTFFVGASLGGAAGLLFTLAYPIVSASTGILIGWKAFVAAVIGGIGDIRGAVLGGFTLGAVEVIATIYASTYRDFICYSLLLVILIFKPYGLLGRAPNQKV